VDLERSIADRHEQHVDREAHAKRMYGAAVGDEEPGAGRQRSKAGEAEQPSGVALGDEQRERLAGESRNVEDAHAVQAAHFQVKEGGPRN
jgi:hypothetical protein